MEEYRDIPGYEAKYMATSLGRIYSKARRIGKGSGYVMRGKILKPSKDKDGYLHVALQIGGRKNKTYRVHRLIFNTFSPGVEYPAGFQICHKDGDKENNRENNLYLGNQESNTLDKYKHKSTKLSIQQVKEIKKSTDLQRVVAKKYGITQATVSRIKAGKRAKYIK